ncbi:MAG: hypothetical protein LBJ15_09370 [Comamonas sp.]|jgi:hypothetical protein|uniref:hypothetical protein n=1 Tax=Comamonas sp. TaxID=34028 RepID=UPI002820E69C|nr:hypothetical protein [Comamonas sp.]MDR0214197.1 hypothetical protein [Comamonas sp.]
MNWLVGSMMVLVGLILLWAFSAIFISMLAGLLTSALLWQPLRFWRSRQLMRALEQNPALDLQQEVQNHPAWFHLLTTLVIWLGCAAMLFTLLQLPENLYSPEQLVMAAGIVYLVSLWALIKGAGNLLSLSQPPQQAEQTRALWSLGAGLVPMLSLVAWIFFIPNTAGWMVWREEAHGYRSTQLRIPLANDDAERRQALLQLVQPLLEQGSRVLSHTSRSRGGGSYTQQAALPARYRFHEGALELQLAGVMPQPQLELQLLALKAVVQGELPGSLPLAYAQCQPTPRQLQKQRFLSRGSQVVQQMRDCMSTRQSALDAALPLLQGQLQEPAVQIVRFSPWWTSGHWQAANLPGEKELDGLNSL